MHDDRDHAHEHDHEHSDDRPQDPAAFWEARYAGNQRVWSGRANAALMTVAADLVPGSALDLACGEGADVLWLAERGWQATGVDISASAVERGRAAAAAAGLSEQTAFVVEVRVRQGTAPDGEAAELEDSVVLLRREPARTGA